MVCMWKNSQFPFLFLGLIYKASCVSKEIQVYMWHATGGRHLGLHAMDPSNLVYLWRNYAAFILACRLTLCCFSLQTMLVVSWLEPCGTAAMGSSLSSVATEFSAIQLSVICHCGQSNKVNDLLIRCCLPLGHPWGSSGTCAAVLIISPSNCGKAASGKLVWK